MIRIAAMVLVLTLAAAAAAAEPVIVTGAGARLRAEPSTTAPVAGRLGLGAEAEAGEASGSGAETWRRVSLPSGESGWMSAVLLAPIDPARPDAAYLAVARQKDAATKPAFGDAVELVEFARAAAGRAKTAEARAELGLIGYLALQKSLATLPFENPSPAQQAWVEKERDNIVYSEPAGEYYVRAQRLWDLEGAGRRLPIADRIAWEAAQIPLPGECEGYVPCYLAYAAEQEGQYLERHPKGAHAREALATIEETVAGALKDVDGSNRDFGDFGPDLKAATERLKRQIAPVAGSQKALGLIAQLQKKG